MTKIIHILKIINKHSSFSLDYLKSLLKETKGDLNYFIRIVITSYSKNFDKVLAKTKDIENIKKKSIYFPLKAVRMKALFYTKNNDYIKIYNFLHKNINKIPLDARNLVEILMKEIEVNSKNIKTSKILLNIQKIDYMQPYKFYYLGIKEFNNKKLEISKKYLNNSFILGVKNNNPDITILSLLKLYEITDNIFYFNRALEYAFFNFELSKKLSYYYNLFIEKIEDKNLNFINKYLNCSVKNNKYEMFFNSKMYLNKIDLEKNFNLEKPLSKFSKKIGISRVTLSNIKNKKVKKISSNTVKKLLPYFIGENFNYIIYSEIAKEFIEKNKILYNSNLVRKYLSFYLSMEFFSQDYELLSKEMINLLNNKLDYKSHNNAKLELSFFFYIDKIAPLKSLFKLYNSFLVKLDYKCLKKLFKIYFQLDIKEKRVLTKFIRNIARFKSLEIDLKIEHKISIFSDHKILDDLKLSEKDFYKPYIMLEEEEKEVLLNTVFKKF